MKERLGLIVHTCDKYGFCWANWWYFFSRAWNLDWPLDLYFVNEEKAVSFHPKLRQIKTGPGPWSDRLMRALEQIDNEIVIYTQEDFWYTRPVDFALLETIAAEFRANDLSNLKLCTFKWTKFENGQMFCCRKLVPLDTLSSRIFVYDSSNPYLQNHQVSLWKKDFLASTLIPGESPWENEHAGTERIRERRVALHAYLGEPYPIRYVTTVERGSYNELGRNLMRAHGLCDETGKVSEGAAGSLGALRTVSVIIPSFNRCNTLMKNLACLEGQTYSRELFEVLVIDDCSTDGTMDFLSSYKGPLKLRFMRNPDGAPDKYGYISCQNHGLKMAENELCIFLDDDLLSEKNLISEHVRTHNDWLARGEEVVCRGWRTEEFTVDDLGSYDMAEDALYNWKLRYYIECADGINPSMCIGNNFSVLRKNALAVGGFGEDLYRYGQDRRVPIKCQQMLGLRIVANVRAFGSHLPHPKDGEGMREGKVADRIERNPFNKLKCLLELTKAYLKDGRSDLVQRGISEARALTLNELGSNPEILALLDSLSAQPQGK